MTRHEFPVAVKREALARSGGQCEAVGERYGFPAGVRCQRRVYKGHVNYEHWPRGAHDPHPDTVKIGNCTAICPTCNQFANNHSDTPREQKMKGVAYDEALHRARMDRKAGLDTPDPEKPKGRRGKKGKPIQSPGFRKDVHRPLRSGNSFRSKR